MKANTSVLLLHLIEEGRRKIRRLTWAVPAVPDISGGHPAYQGAAPSHPVYIDAHTTSVVANPEGDPELEALTSINVYEVIEKTVQEKVLTEMKKLLPTHVSKAVANFVKPRINNSIKLLNQMQLNKSNETHQQLYNTLYDSVNLDQEALNAQDAEPSFHRRTHDN
ncbi:hypothetical protein Tco_1106864 [Tanacetum coccineum]